MGVGVLRRGGISQRLFWELGGGEKRGELHDGWGVGVMGFWVFGGYGMGMGMGFLG